MSDNQKLISIIENLRDAITAVIICARMEAKVGAKAWTSVADNLQLILDKNKEHEDQN
jgi:hypothetical protein